MKAGDMVFAGLKSYSGKTLTQEQIDAFDALPDKDQEWICNACTAVGSSSLFERDGLRYCPRCREYKYLQPLIPGWNDHEFEEVAA